MGEKKEALQTEWEEVRYLGQGGILSLTAEFIVISYCARTKYLRQYWHQYQLQYQYKYQHQHQYYQSLHGLLLRTRTWM